MAITASDLEQMSKLAKLGITEEEREYGLRHMTALLDYVTLLQEVDVTGVEPTLRVLGHTNVFRQDKPGACLRREDALELAPEHEGGYFKVPSIL